MGQRRDRRKPAWWQELLILIGLALVVSLVVKTFFVQMFYVPSASMRPELVENDRILVEKFSSWDGEVERGDVVVFEDPGNWLGVAPEPTGIQALLSVVGLYPDGGHLVKRVIGVGGDEVRCCDKRGRITVNGVALHEKSYLAPGEKPSMIKFDVKVQPGYLWVQGDNRSNSADSRVHLGDPGGGQIPVEDVVGKVFMIVWPLDHARVVDRPATFDAVE